MAGGQAEGGSWQRPLLKCLNGRRPCASRQTVRPEVGSPLSPNRQLQPPPGTVPLVTGFRLRASREHRGLAARSSRPPPRGLVATAGLSPWPHTLGPHPGRPMADKDSAAGPAPRHKPTKPEPRLRAPACLTHRSPHASCRRGNPPPGPTDASWTSSHSQSRRLGRKEEERLQQPDPQRRGPLLNSRGPPPLPPPQPAPCGPNQELKWRPRRGQGKFQDSLVLTLLCGYWCSL